MYLFKNAGYSWAGWKVDYRDQDLRDIDTVMNYFDGMSNYYSMFEALTHAFTRGETKKIESEYFTVNCYKKGTIHLTFNDENILRRFNVAACMGKKWLPCDYGAKGFDELPMAEKDVVESFEGRKSYTLNRKQPIFARNTSMLQLEEVTQKQATMF